MAFCGKCGASVADGEKFCPECGAPVAAEGTVGSKANDFADKAKNVLNTEDTTGEYDAQDIQNTKGIAWLSYLGVLVFIPMFTNKESKFTRFHVRQGVTLFALWVVYFILDILLSMIKVTKTVWGIPYRVTPWPITLLLAIVGIGISVLAIIGIVNAATGKAKKLPIIGNIDVMGMFGVK
ncbi:MAG: zinc-ribbon domain-containing protein [Clostridia bacterium]|nr:zinc-ribbon domain-containing protein [Clostridia bacterium]